MAKYLSHRALEGLKSYQYKPAGYTILDDWHTPFWNWAVERLPMWLAPNLITLLGTMCLVVSYLVSMYYLPDFNGDAPRWVYVLSAVCVVAYCQLDCLDGKQARRTRTSSPLGQLFDHGCDAISVHLILSNIASSLSMPCGWAHGVGQMGVMFTWILAHWEEYHTSIMLYGNSFYGVLEANYSIMAIHLITAALGPGLWRRPARDVASFLPQYFHDFTLNQVVVLVLITVGFYQASCNIYRTFSFNPQSLPLDERGHKQLGKRAAVAHLMVLTSLVGLGALWLSQPAPIAWLCRAQNLEFGVTYALTASMLIMAHMCKEPFEPPLWAIASLAAGAVNSRFRLIDPLVYALALDAAVLGVYLHYVLGVIAQICDYLGIYCLTIKRKPTHAE